jgi:hypothetical protein
VARSLLHGTRQWRDEDDRQAVFGLEPAQ